MGLQRRLHTPQTLRNGIVKHYGWIAGNGTSAPDTFEFKGVASSDLGRSAAGIYTVVLPGAGTIDILSAQLTCLSADDRIAYVQSYVAATRTLTFRIEDAAGTNTDLTSSERVYLDIAIKNSSVP